MKTETKSKSKLEVKGHSSEISYYSANFTVQYLSTGYAFGGRTMVKI
jgi:hypothetical protein